VLRCSIARGFRNIRMQYYADFSKTEELPDEPLVIHRHGEMPGRALIILAHGLGGTRYGTWTPKGLKPSETGLPRFLYDDIEGLDVGLYKYRTLFGRLRWWKSIELHREAELLADRIRMNAESYRIIILGGHSMGGILVRAAIRELIDRNDTATLTRVRGLALLATPQAGSLRVPRFAWGLTADARALSPHNELTLRIQQIFTERVVAEASQAKPNQYVIPAYVVAAAEDNWVDQFSAGLNVSRDRILNVRGSHTSAVKPRTRNDDAYLWIRNHIRALVESIRSEARQPASVPLTVDEAVKADIADALASAFTVDDLTRHLSSHLGLIATGIGGNQANQFASVVEWAARDWRWTRALVRLMVEECPNNMRVAALVLKYSHFGSALTVAEREQVRVCLADVVRDWATLNELVSVSLGVRLDALLLAAPQAPIETRLPFVIRLADHTGGMEAFIQAALERFPGPVLQGKVGPLLTVIRLRRETPSAVGDPFEAHDLGGKFLINRSVLRNAIRGVVDTTNKTRVVAVKGPSRSGKSHSIYFIEHIEQRLGKYDKAVVRLELDEPAATFTPQQLAGSILDLINGNRSGIPEKTVDVTETRWIRRIADYLVGQIKGRPRPVFVVLDGFANESLPPLTRELVRELVKRADSEPNLRIGLLDYNSDLLSIEGSGRSVAEPLTAFTEADLKRFFTAVARAQGEMNPPQNAIDVIVQSVLEAVPPGDPERNEQIAREVETWTQKLKGSR
jgi:pimeloyl-ACP methyl ester carboxylesterase